MCHTMDVDNVRVMIIHYLNNNIRLQHSEHYYTIRPKVNKLINNVSL